MDWVALIAERRIQEAIDNGEFDNNPLKGKPLNLDEDAHLPPEQRVARKILKNAGALPQWMQLEVDIRKERERVELLKTRAAKTLAKLTDATARERVHGRLRYELKDSMDAVNTMILQYDMVCPMGYARPFPRYNIARELEQLGAPQ